MYRYKYPARGCWRGSLCTARSAFLLVSVVIIHVAEILNLHNLSKDQRELVEVLGRASNNLLCIINDVLDMSKIEAGYMELDKNIIDIDSVIDESIELMSIHSKKQDVAITRQVSVDIPKSLIGDDARLRQILINLISNAIKFTSKGGKIEIVATNHREPDNTALIHFAIKDSGIGIPNGEKKKIFSTFSQAHNHTSKKFNGTGLGLSICQTMVKKMSGNIWVEDNYDNGCTFHFTAKLIVQNFAKATIEQESRQRCPFGKLMPTDSRGFIKCGQCQQKDDCPATNISLKPYPLQILVVDDDIMSQKVAIDILGEAGHDLVVVNNGEEAVGAILKRDFDMIFMDLKLPGMDGYKTATTIRNIEKQCGKQTTIVALTAQAFTSDMDKCLDVGMNGYIAKPVSKQKFFAAIGERPN